MTADLKAKIEQLEAEIHNVRFEASITIKQLQDQASAGTKAALRWYDKFLIAEHALKRISLDENASQSSRETARIALLDMNAFKDEELHAQNPG